MTHKTGPFRFETPAGKSHYTKLFACISEEEDGYMVQVRLFNEKKPEIYALYSDSIGKLMDRGTVRETLKYYDDFYDIIGNSRAAKRSIIEACIARQ